MDSYVSLDLETTGLNPKHEKIIEIGAVKIIDNAVADTFSTFVNPGRKLDEHTKTFTGISDADLEGAESIENIIPKLVEFIGDLPLLGHRILFDYSFVKCACVNANLPFEKEGVDTLKISRACCPELPSKKLVDMCAHYKMEYQAHRAYNDSLATAKLFACLRKDYEKKYPELFVPQKLTYTVKKESPVRPVQLERLQSLIERKKIDCPYELNRMSRNEAARYYDILVAKYGK